MKPFIRPTDNKKSKKFLIACLAILIPAIVLSWLWLRASTSSPTVNLGGNYSYPSNAGQNSAQAQAISNSASENKSDPQSAKAQTKYSEVDTLAKSKNLSDNFAAYKIIRDCVKARKDELVQSERIAHGGIKPIKSAQELCGNISSDQIASRLILLRRAAEAGIHDAAANYADEGPTGEGYSADTPEDDADNNAFQIELRKQIEAGVATRDWWSLLMMSGINEDKSGDKKPDYDQAIADLDAANNAYKEEFGHDMKSYAENHGRLTYFKNLPSRQ